MSSAAQPVDKLFMAFQLALAGRYSIDRELGRGGMGVVYLAREVHLDRMVAIKLLPPERATDPELRTRFVHEARLAAKLSHPNIIPIHAVDEAQDFVFYVMAFIDGETLAHRIRTRGPLPSTEGARVLREVAWALAHAHSHGLVHRDVKPDNILLESGSGRVFVADFGIAAVARDLSGAGVPGTPEFMSPEQALAKEVDARSDLYSLGVTAFYMFAGRLPFEATTATEMLAKHVTEPAPSLASTGMPVARRLSALVDRCLAKEPEHRPPSADALAEMLGAALEQRRELPAALRAFVKRSSRLNGPGTMFAPALILGAAVGASAWINIGAGAAALVLGAVGVPLAYFVNVARKLMRLGFAHQDVGPAFASEIEQAIDERAASGAINKTRSETVLRIAAVLGWSAFFYSFVSLFFLTARNGSLLWFAQGALLMGALMGVVSTVAYVSVLERRRDIDTEFWGRIWRGRIGKFAFSIAKRFLGSGVRASAVTHRATELSLGLAAESLFDGLPPESRRALGDLPKVTRRLQEDAQRLRKLYDELQDAVTTVGDASLSEDHAALRADRDRVHAKLGEAVGALETIRLNLLRLHAGSGSLEGLTTHVDVAADVSAEVERMLAARAEVERVVKGRE